MSDQPPLADYGLIGDCHGAALVSRSGSIDWCCLPRLDSPSCFGRLLDWKRGGFCSISVDGAAGSARYLDDTLVLETTFEADGGEARLLDCMTMRRGGATKPRREILRIVECRRGKVELAVCVAPRFDFGAVRPWLRHEAVGTFSAVGSDSGLVIWCDHELENTGDELRCGAVLHGGERLHLSMRFRRPEEIETTHHRPLDRGAAERRLERTIRWWRSWARRARYDGPDAEAVLRSAMTLRALTYAPTGAIVAAPTTSLPEAAGGSRNWDYRFSWVRDSTFSVRALAELGYESEAARFWRFIVRACAGHADDLQIVFGIAGERRLTEVELPLAGYQGATPVRVGNAACEQLQLDAYGELLNMCWRWHRRGHSPSDDEWHFIAELVETVTERWREPDSGVWEWRGGPKHFVHSKAGCWSAIDRGLRLAEECARRAPARRWRAARNELREAIESKGYDARRGVFVQAFGTRDLDAASLLLPLTEFVSYDDERMVRTADAIREELAIDGLLRRYGGNDGLQGEDSAFVACSFWLAECYARQGRVEDARAVFDQAMTAGNALGLFSEQYDPRSSLLLGNFPQGLTHLSHIAAAHAIAAATPAA